MKSGISYGKYMLLQRRSTSYGGFVEDAYQRALVFKKGVYRVPCLVLFVIMMLKMIGMCCFIVNLVPKVDIALVWNHFLRIGFNKVGICEKLYLAFVPLLIKTRQGCLLHWFGYCGITVTIAFGIT
jgi:hypothetical protein